MFKLKFTVVSVSFVFLVTLTGCASNTKLTKFPDCAGENCFKVAHDTTLPSTVNEIFSTSLQVQNYIFFIQSAPQKILTIEPNSIYVVGADNSLLNISVQNNISANSDISIPPGGNFKVADATEIIFTKTPKDEKPKNKTDQWLWNRALFSKCTMFECVNEVFLSKSGNFKLYYFENSKDKISEAYIFNNKNRDEFIYIYGERINFDEFTSIVTSIEIKQ